jgi:2-polyprenyl-3-methyl-5-hydroxy-6-metoxy-1,4-benzoquinol methylase
MKPLRLVYNWLERPHRLLAVWTVLSRPGTTLLDVGCGNHSPSITRRHVPRCVYHGLDRQDWNVNARDKACADLLLDIDLTQPETLSTIADETYDVVICSHLLEHLPDPYSVAHRLAFKVKPGGVIYLEVPSPHSTRLPRANHGWCGIHGCLNFYDDPTHQTLIELPRLAAMLRQQGFRVAPIRYRFLWRRVLLLPAYVLAGLILRGYVPASVVWDVTGFAQYLVAEKLNPRPAVDTFHHDEVQDRCQAA